MLCFRLIHHLPTPHHRNEIIGELCRVAKSYVLISYLSPWSYTSAQRLLKQKLGIKVLCPEHHPAGRDSGLFQLHGYTLVKDFARASLVHSLHLAVFRK